MDMTNSQNGQADQSNNTWQADYIKNALQNGQLEVTFIKKDGSERTMRCTLKADLLPEQTDLEEQVQKKTPNPDVLKVWDLEKTAWRSFRFDSIIGFSESSNGIS